LEGVSEEDVIRYHLSVSLTIVLRSEQLYAYLAI
jgi:hypothetical protein